MMSIKNILVFASFPQKDVVGGHIISALQLAESFHEKGYNVHLLTKASFEGFKRMSPGITLIDDAYTSKFKGYWKRGRKIHQLIQRNRYDLIVCIDKVSCYHASIPATWNKVPLVQIIPGGGSSATRYPPIKTKKIIAFSEENKEALVNEWRFRPEDVIIRNSRFSFSSEQLEDYSRPTHQFRIAYMSGLREPKLKAFTYFLSELKENIFPMDLQIDVIGDGMNRELFEEEVHRFGINNLHFAGYKTINLDILQHYHLVITMGRGVIECASMRMPVAICGENGYMGLITGENIGKFKKTNLTGRAISTRGNLRDDMLFLAENGFGYTGQLSEEVRKEFDVKHLREEILNLVSTHDMICCEGSVIRTTWKNVEVFINKRKRILTTN